MMVSRVEGASVRRIEEGLRSAPPTKDPKPPREYVYGCPPPSDDVVHARIKVAAILPSALAVACDKHNASAGEKCFSAGVCGERLQRRGGAS